MYELKAVDKHFPGVHALKAVDFKVNRGEIVGLVGENGAGKSTLMKVIYGAYQPDGGDIRIDGKTMRFQNPRQAMDHGIGMVFQEQSLILNLTVMEKLRQQDLTQGFRLRDFNPLPGSFPRTRKKNSARPF